MIETKGQHLFTGNLKQYGYKGYESFREDIQKNIDTGESRLTREQPVFLAKTSGTISSPKYIPITMQGKKLYKQSMKLTTFNIFLHRTKALCGKIFLFTSPSREELLKQKHFAGSMSGILRDESPTFIKKKFTPPLQLSTIESYHDKYLLFALMTLCEGNIAILCA